MQKYAEASEATVRLVDNEGTLAFEVADDGAGFDATTARKGTGLTNMSDRAEALGGNVRVESQLGAGTRVCGTLPVPVGVAALL